VLLNRTTHPSCCLLPRSAKAWPTRCYGPRGIRINAIAPGPILTADGIGAAPSLVRNHVAEMLPFRRLGEASEVARVAAWLLSDAASFVTGTTIPIDGGKLAAS